MIEQTTLTDTDRAILSRLKLPACRNESRSDDARDYRTLLARESINAYNAFHKLGRQSPRALLFTEGLENPGSLRMWMETTCGSMRPYWHGTAESVQGPLGDC